MRNTIQYKYSTVNNIVLVQIDYARNHGTAPEEQRQECGVKPSQKRFKEATIADDGVGFDIKCLETPPNWSLRGATTAH
jgi:hypothetical protein